MNGLVDLSQQFTLNLSGYAKSNGFEHQANGEFATLWTGAERNAGYDDAERMVLRGITTAVSPRRLVMQMREGGHIGYNALTSTTPDPVESSGDLDDWHYHAGLAQVIDYAMWQVVEGRREALLDQGIPIPEAREMALVQAKAIFYYHASETDASDETYQTIDQVASNIYNPIATWSSMQRTAA